jgi:hypothetical protein
MQQKARRQKACKHKNAKRFCVYTNYSLQKGLLANLFEVNSLLRGLRTDSGGFSFPRAQHELFSVRTLSRVYYLFVGFFREKPTT